MSENSVLEVVHMVKWLDNKNQKEYSSIIVYGFVYMAE